MKLDLDAIERKAKAVTRGAWYRDADYPLQHVASTSAGHIIAASPPVVLALVAIARKARAFVDEQGKFVHEGELDARRYFAGDEFSALVKALEGAGL